MYTTIYRIHIAYVASPVVEPFEHFVHVASNGLRELVHHRNLRAQIDAERLRNLEG